ncbi:hypothetical protein Pan44_40380 [Caulifigura coniformis]|uniref:G domain-containing protein n=1 Tax=Caulifigura coniformis TaxID=2527983 RepID=A0A517SIR7_9PLAN|nr:GTPase [Caulifigura coniformis]QDT55989.1 hypothetical protein Pan44_40380 [Caulifigura coniformis]
MSSNSSVANAVARLCRALQAFEASSKALQLQPLSGREWYEVLTRKLRPQLGDESFLIAAVVGGTNIGKSVVFNHVAGFRASATSPLASGTRHPTCLAPAGFGERHDLGELFAGFEVTPWERAEDALRDDAVHRLFWRESPEMRSNLLVLDTPDIDSDARVNWDRADHVRQCADVLIAVLTQQKYNDAAVKEFFRKAAAEDKAIIVVLNQLLMPEDEAYWPLWVETFCRETGVHPEAVYLAPNDRRAAEANALPFYVREWPAGPVEASAVTTDPRSLLEDLSETRFEEVKWRALRGSVRQVVDRVDGVPGYLTEARRRCEEFRGAGELLSANKLAEIREWPVVPAAAVIGELRRWWREQREGWSRKVHGFYNAVGNSIAWPVRKLKDVLQGPAVPMLNHYREREWGAILTAVESVYDRLTVLAELGNPLLQPRLQSMLAGASRVDLIAKIREAHQSIDFEAELRTLVDSELKSFRTDSPTAYEAVRRLDAVAAAARPATSVILFVTGFGPVGHAITPVFADAAVQGVMHFAGDVAGGTVAAAVGETVLSAGAGTGAGYFEARFRQLENAFTQRRAAWLASLLQQQLLGTLPQDLQMAARVTGSQEFRELESAVAELSAAESTSRRASQ